MSNSIIFKNIFKNLIENKYKFSNKEYNKKFEKEDPKLFLFYFDMMNVYPLFPTPIDIDINFNNSNDFLLETISSNNFSLELKKELDKIVNIWKHLPKKLFKTREKPMIRKFFSYEIIDEIKNKYNAEYVTVAWLKCYEIVMYYKLLDNLQLNEKTVNYFGICEQPGAFLYSLNHYIKTQTYYDFNFIIESLIDKSNKKIFKAENKLFSKYKNRYDYGADGTGDVTNIENIKFYREKYIKKQKKKFHIITADCGLDCSVDFIEQERKLLDVFFGQYLLAISICSKGSNYFYKQFTLHEKISQDLIVLSKKLFENVYICRTLTTKPQSGEIYVVCKNFMKTEKEMDELLPKLFDIYTKIKNKKINSFIKENSEFKESIININNLLLMRRITSIYFIYFRFMNSVYAKNNMDKIHNYIDDLVGHYTNYFIKYYKIEKIEDTKKLLY